MAHHDAVFLNGADRILISGAPPRRMMPNGCMGNPALYLTPILTRTSSWMPSWLPDLTFLVAASGRVG
jgi:hypothetical protein